MISNQEIHKRLAKYNKYYDGLLDYFGHQEYYTSNQIRKLWKLSGLTIEEVAAKLCRSYERARDYCYGKSMSNKLKRSIAKFFKVTIYDNIYMGKDKKQNMS